MAETRWKVTIEDSKDGSVNAYDTNAVVAVISRDGGTQNAFLTECSVFELAEMFLALDNLNKKMRKAAPSAYALAKKVYMDMKKEKGDVDETDG